MPYIIKETKQVTALEVVDAVLKGQEVSIKLDDHNALNVTDALYDAQTHEVVYLWGAKCEEAWDFAPNYEQEEVVLPTTQSVSIVEFAWRRPRSWQDCLPCEVRAGIVPLNEDIVWQAIADYRECDVNEIADGDLIEHL